MTPRKEIWWDSYLWGAKLVGYNQEREYNKKEDHQGGDQ